MLVDKEVVMRSVFAKQWSSEIPVVDFNGDIMYVHIPTYPVPKVASNLFAVMQANSVNRSHQLFHTANAVNWMVSTQGR